MATQVSGAEGVRRGHGSSVRRAASVEQRADLGVLDLPEVPVELPHRREPRGDLDDDDLIGVALERVDRSDGCDRHREHDAVGTGAAHVLDSRERGQPGGEPVVDDQRRAVLERQRRQPRAKRRQRVVHLRERRARVVAHVLRGEPRDRVRVHLAVGGHRADRVLGVAGRAHLGRDDHVERQIELARDLCGHHHPAPRDAEHHGIFVDPEFGELLGELASGVCAVCEHGERLLLQFASANNSMHQWGIYPVQWHRSATPSGGVCRAPQKGG